MYWIALAVITAVIFGFVGKGQNNFDWNVSVLVATATILIWYSFETRAMRLISIRPGMTLRWIRDNGNADWMLILTNQGKGPALNISLNSMDSEYSLDFGKINAIAAGDYVPVKILKNGKVLTNENILELAGSPLVVSVEFCSSENKNLKKIFSTTVELRNPPSAIIKNILWS